MPRHASARARALTPIMSSLAQPPEFFDHRMKCDCKADVFSFGVLVREVFLGRIPSKRAGYDVEQDSPIYSLLQGGDDQPHHGGALAYDRERRCTAKDIKLFLEECVATRKP